MPASYKISILSSGTWITPSGSPGPDSPADLVYIIHGINGLGLQPNTPAQNITGTITLLWLPATAPVYASITISKDTLFNADRTVLQAAWEQFLGNLDGQEGSNHYMQPGGARATAGLLAQNMPMLLTEIAYYCLRFSVSSSHHFIDLQPGMRLLMAYGNFYSEQHSGNGQQLESFSTSGISYADIQTDYASNSLVFNSFLALQKTSVQPSSPLPAGNVQIAASLVDLASQPIKPYHRIFYPVNAYTGNDTASLSVADSVSIVSSFCYGSLGNEPNALPIPEVCNPLYPKIYPTVFFGRCTLVVQICIKVNGKSAYVSAGTTLKNIIETAQPTSSQPSMLQVSRYLNEQKAVVLFPAGNTTIGLTMPILPGDEITWLPLGNFSLVERIQAIYRITTPSPDALALGHLAIVSYGDIAATNLPAADDMSLALLESHDTPNPYTAPQIAVALFTIYNAAPFTDPYTGGELAYSLYYAGFSVLDVSAGVVAGYTPAITMETGGTLVGFLLLSGIGYFVTDIGKGVYTSLDSSLPANAFYLVKSLIEGSFNYGQLYAPGQVAEGVLHAVGFDPSSAYLLAGSLMQGSSLAETAKQEYVATATAAALYYAYNTTGITLTQDNLAMALAKPFFGQALGYPVDQVALGIFSVYPLSNAGIIATALVNSGVSYSINDVAKGTYAVKNYSPSPGHILTTEELAFALYTAYGTQAVNTPKNVAVALVYAIDSVTANEVASAIATVFGYLNPEHTYTQENVSTVAQAITNAFTYAGTIQADVNITSTSLLFAFTDLTTVEMANGLVAGFNYTLSGTNLAGMSATCIGIITAYQYASANQAQVTATASSLQNAFHINVQDQPCVNTLAESLVDGWSTIQILILVTALVQTGSYVKTKSTDVILPTQATAIALAYSATNQSQLNALCSAVTSAMTLDGKTQNDVNFLSIAISQINGTAVAMLNNGVSLQTTFGYTGANQPDVNQLAIALSYGYTLNPTIQNNVNALATSVIGVFAFDKNTQAQVVATGTALVACFGFKTSSQANINSCAIALVSSFNYPGFQDRTYAIKDAQLVSGSLHSVFGMNIAQMLPAQLSGFPQFLPVDAGNILTILYKLTVTSSSDISLLGSLIGTTYQLSIQPYGVASVSLSLFAPGYNYLACTGWIGKWYKGWTGADFTIFNNVFTQPLWTAALTSVNSRQSLNAMATSLQTTYDPSHNNAVEMVQILAACYHYLDASVSVIPVGTAMKAAGYSLILTSGAMGNGQYKAQWNMTYYNQLVAIFTGG